MGDLRGKMAKERGITIDELNALGEQDGSSDAMIDNYQKHLGETEDAFIIEGRLCWHFIPRSFKILLTCDTNEAARRIFNARQQSSEGRDDERAYANIEETERTIIERMASDTRRYQKYYGLDYQDPSHYDLVIDTTMLSGPDVTAKTIFEYLPVE